MMGEKRVIMNYDQSQVRLVIHKTEEGREGRGGGGKERDCQGERDGFRGKRRMKTREDDQRRRMIIRGNGVIIYFSNLSIL